MSFPVKRTSNCIERRNVDLRVHPQEWILAFVLISTSIQNVLSKSGVSMKPSDNYSNDTDLQQGSWVPHRALQWLLLFPCDCVGIYAERGSNLVTGYIESFVVVCLDIIGVPLS
jgi:hypothetical protein